MLMPGPSDEGVEVDFSDSGSSGPSQPGSTVLYPSQPGSTPLLSSNTSSPACCSSGDTFQADTPGTWYWSNIVLHKIFFYM